MRNLFLFLVFVTFQLHASSPLKNYYKGKIDLTESEILLLVDEVITEKPSDHLVAYAYYLKAIRYRRDSKNLQAYETYSLAIKHLTKADTVDSYLKSAILQNQGVILKHHGLFEGAVEKYEQALSSGYRHSKERGLSVKYNLGRALAYVDPERTVKVFFEALEEAEVAGLKDRQVKVLNEIGLMFTRSGDYEGARKYFEKALYLTESDPLKALSFQNISHVYLQMEKYTEQEEWLEKALALYEDADRFISLMDLGECYLNQDQPERSLEVLLEAQSWYEDKPLTADHIKLFELLPEVSPDSTRYYRKGMYEYKKLALAKEKLEKMWRREAMINLLDRMNAEEEKEEKVALFLTLVIITGLLAMGIYFFWFRRWRKEMKRKKRREEKIQKLAEEGFEDLKHSEAVMKKFNERYPLDPK